MSIGTRVLAVCSWVFALILVSWISVQAQSAARLSFNPGSIKSANGETFVVEIMVNTGGSDVGGVGAKINFDPSMLQVLSITPGNLFGDYPIATIDNSLGKLSISGIVSSANNLYNGAGVFAQIEVKVIGTKSTQMVFDFTPGQTRDSNVAVTYGNGDALASVGSLQVLIDNSVPQPPASNVPNSVAQTQPISGQSSSAPSSTTEESVVNQAGRMNTEAVAMQATPSKGFLDKIIGSFSNFLVSVGLKEPEPEFNQDIDPYAPIGQQPPITDPNRSQASVVGTPTGLPEDQIPAWMLFGVLGVLVLVLVLGANMFFYARLKHQGLRLEKPTSEDTGPVVAATNPHPQPTAHPTPHGSAHKPPPGY